MIKCVIKKIFETGFSKNRSKGKRKEYGVKDHGIDLAQVNKRAIEICDRLQEAGHEAYLVGGAVRDLLLGLSPKDFDVATSATPEQVKVLFRRAFIIGRRFRIVHVVFGGGRKAEVIEVTTFRANVNHTQAHQVQGNRRSQKVQLHNIRHAVNASGRILRDNVWGTQEEDAVRRDFSINALYYDPHAQVVVDYHAGMEDARALRIRIIGDAQARYREDPVRVLRAARFAAKLAPLGFRLAVATAKPLAEAKGLLSEVPLSRMFDEMLKLFQTGHALSSVEQLRKLHLDSGLYSLQDLIMARADSALVHLALQETDVRVAAGKSVLPSFLLACVLWQDIAAAWERNIQASMPHFVAMQEAIDEVFQARIGDITGRGRLGADMREIWSMQLRFTRRSGKAPYSLVQQERFRAGLNFLRLRGQVGEVEADLAVWWEAFFNADVAQRDLMQKNMVETHGAGRKSRRTKKTLASNAVPVPISEMEVDARPVQVQREVDTSLNNPAGAADSSDMPTAAKRKRRGRRGTREGKANAALDTNAFEEDGSV